MTEYRFSLIIEGGFSKQLSDEELLGATDALGEAGCDDCLVSARGRGLELEFDRADSSLDDAVRSAIADVNAAGFRVARIEIEPNCLIAQQSAGSGTHG